MARKQKKRSGTKLPWGKILLWVFLLTGVYGFFDAEIATQYALLLTAVSGAALLLCYRKKLFRKKRKVEPKASAAPAGASTGGSGRIAADIEVSGKTLRYRLAGVTFEGRQKWLKKISQIQDNYGDVSFELEPYDWKGEPACRVLAYLEDRDEPVDIGNIPAAAAANVCGLMERVASVDVEVYGGPEYEGDDKSFGAEVTIGIK